MYLSLKLTADYFCVQLIDILLEDLEESIGNFFPLASYNTTIGEPIQKIIQSLADPSLGVYDFINTLDDTFQLKSRYEIVDKLKPLVRKNLQDRSFLATVHEDKTIVISDYSKNHYLFLRSAVKAGNKELIEQWLQSETTATIQKMTQQKFPPYNETFLIMTAKRGHSSTVELLLNYHDTNKQHDDLKTILEQTNRQGIHALGVAVENTHLPVIKILLTYAKKLQILKEIFQPTGHLTDTLLIKASKIGNQQVVEVLLAFSEKNITKFFYNNQMRRV